MRDKALPVRVILGRSSLRSQALTLVLRHHDVPSPRLYTHPEVSPLFGDFAGFPPLLLQTGSSEMLRDEAVRAAHKAHAAGVDVELEIWNGTPHVFQVASFLPQATRALDHITRFVCTRAGWDRVPPVAMAATGRSAGWRIGWLAR